MAEALRVEYLLRAAVHDGTAPALAFAVSRAGGPERAWYVGHHRPSGRGEPCGPLSVFDLASLTKPLTTLTWVLRLADRGALDLRSPVGSHLTVEDPLLARAPVWRLLSHTAGLPAHRRYFAGLGHVRAGAFDRGRRAIRRMLLRTELESAPGERERYSDLGYMLLEWICEQLDGRLSERWATLPGHGPDRLHLRPLIEPTPLADPGCAATEQCPWRQRLLQGEVHDENCWAMGGVGGHAGTFGTLSAVHAMGVGWLDLLGGRVSTLGLDATLGHRASDRARRHPSGTHVVGWDTPTPGASSSGRCFGRRTIGHLGFTGTSIWIDPEQEVVMTLLTNRVSPTRENLRIRALRPKLHDAGWAWLRSCST